MNIYRHTIIVLLSLMSFITVAGEKVDQTIPAGSAKGIYIENLYGSVFIEGWEKDNISVQGELDDNAKDFIFEKKGSEIIIKVAMPNHINNHNWRDSGSNLTIKVPKSMRMNFQGVSSDVTVKNLTKSTELKTVNGNINATYLSGHVELASVNGDIESENLTGKIKLSTVSGNINDQKSSGRLNIKAVSGSVFSNSLANEVKAKCVSGSIHLTLASIDQLALSTVSGEVKADLSLNTRGIVKMSSVSGDIDLNFAGNVNANFDLSASAGGDLVNKLTNDTPKRGKYNARTKLNFTTADGSGSVRGSTVSGTIKITD